MSWSQRLPALARRRPPGLPLFFVAVFVVSCTSPDLDSSGESGWVGTITTEGSVTTVVNESGSVWGGAATLVEEASIGVDAGADEYMFGRINDIYVDQRAIYVVDGDVPAVRVYDLDGEHVRDLGRRGQGPGEYVRPIHVGAAVDGRVFVVDQGMRRINVYGADGAPLADVYPLAERVACCNQPFVIDPAGVPWLAHQAPHPERAGALRYTIRAHGVEGVIDTIPVPSLDFEPQSVSVNGREFALPFAAYPVWNLSRSGAVITGTSDRYRFEIRLAGGRTTVVEKYWEPTPVTKEEAEYLRDVWTGQGLAPPGWDGAEIPGHKPAFSAFWGFASGEIWVLRPGRGIRDPACDEPGSTTMCWKDSVAIDAFGADGRFFGPVELPEELRDPFMSGIAPPPLHEGGRVFAVAIDDAGVLRLKRYELVPPSGR